MPTDTTPKRVDAEAPPSEADRLELRHWTSTVLGPDYETREAYRAWQNEENTESERRSRQEREGR